MKKATQPHESMALSIEDATGEVGVGRDTIYGAIREGRLRAKKLGRRTIVLRADLKAYLASLPDA